ncbi:hypothetical protein HXX76_010598 [Chlamydomonas incerta]|uniref:receptor protein serine/threonine kinase n=1 Tax=Chlamydomonas incerta TaxID=51695 RepID=A0A835SX12_CHLIN|nr:hypothetical protein HXX76_010598 [Chlamydomonas incerta]|eukprot:KAG2429814.1 hypothetical protein HXX76_010598 [Chlamydomonas incerta]
MGLAVAALAAVSPPPRGAQETQQQRSESLAAARTVHDSLSVPGRTLLLAASEALTCAVEAGAGAASGASAAASTASAVTTADGCSRTTLAASPAAQEALVAMFAPSCATLGERACASRPGCVLRAHDDHLDCVRSASYAADYLMRPSATPVSATTAAAAAAAAAAAPLIPRATAAAASAAALAAAMQSVARQCRVSLPTCGQQQQPVLNATLTAQSLGVFMAMATGRPPWPPAATAPAPPSSPADVQADAAARSSDQHDDDDDDHVDEEEDTQLVKSLRVAGVFIVLTSGILGCCLPWVLIGWLQRRPLVMASVRAMSAGCILSLALVHVSMHAISEMEGLVGGGGSGDSHGGHGHRRLRRQLLRSRSLLASSLLGDDDGVLGADEDYGGVGGDEAHDSGGGRHHHPFPIGMCVVVFGFLLMAVLESVAHAMAERHIAKAASLSAASSTVVVSTVASGKPADSADAGAAVAAEASDVCLQVRMHKPSQPVEEDDGNGSLRCCNDAEDGAAMAPPAAAVASSTARLALGTATTVADCNALLVALSLHQFFEGFCLASVLLGVGVRRWRMAAMVLAYAVMCPLGIAVGIAIVGTYDGETVASRAVTGTINGVSGGLLLYLAAGMVPGPSGPYPRLPTAMGLTMAISTEAALIAAISNDTIKVAHLVKNLRLEAKGWPLLPILRNTSFTITGDPSKYRYPILDLAFIESKVKVEQDAVFTFKAVELRNTRQRSGFEVDLFAASPGGFVRYEDIVFHCFSCLPPSTIQYVMMSQIPVTVAQNVTPAAQNWCRPQPLLARCYNRTNDLDIHSASAELPVSGLQGVTSGGGYVLEGTDVNFICEEPTTFECGNTKGWDICVRQSIEDVLSRDRTWEILAAAEQQSAALEDGGGDSNTVAVAVGVAVGVGGGLLLLAGGAFLYIQHRRGQQAAQGGPHAAAGKAADAEAPAATDELGNKTSSGTAGDSSAGHNGRSAGEARAVSTSDDSNGAAGAPGRVAVMLAAPPAIALPAVAVQNAAACSQSVNGNGAGACSAGEVGSPPQSGKGTVRQRKSSALAAGGGNLLLTSGGSHTGCKSTVVLGGVSIELDVVLGSGSFGKVFRGAWQGQAVAVKVLHYGQELCRAVHTEVLLSQALKHVNIVNSLHFAQVLPGGRLAAINVNDNGAPEPSTDSATRSVDTALAASGSKRVDKTKGSIMAGSYSRFLNTHDMVNPPSAMFGSSLAAGRAAATAAAAAADRSGRESKSRHTGGASIAGAAGLSAALGRPVRATAALGGGTGASNAASLGNMPSLTRAASLPLEEIWPLLESEEPRQAAGAAGNSIGPGSGKPRTGNRARAAGAGATAGGPASSRARNGTRVLGRGVLGPVALGAVAQGLGCMGAGGVERSSCSAPDILSEWVAMQAMRRALADDSCSGERLPEEELMALEEGDEEHQQLQQEAAGAHGEGRTAAYVSESGGAPLEEPPAPESDATAVGGGGSTVEQTLSAASNAAGADDGHAGAAGAGATGGALLTGILTGTPRAGGGEGGGEAQTPRITLPLEQLWLAAHAQPVEGSSHGFLVMELCEGGSLQSWRAGQWRARDDRPDMAVLLPLALDIARGMLYIHSAGVCHGDLKLANIMLARTPPAAGAADGAANSGAGSSRRGSHAPPGSGCAVQVPEPRSLREGWVAKVGDFGLSRLLTTERTHVSTRPAGTISHMAPELWSKGHVSPQADVYAYGITLWELATGDKPYRGLNMARLVHRVLVSGGRPALPLWLPPAYTRLVTSCWAPSPKDRPTFAAIVQYLEMMMAALPASNRP